MQKLALQNTEESTAFTTGAEATECSYGKEGNLITYHIITYTKTKSSDKQNNKDFRN